MILSRNEQRIVSALNNARKPLLYSDIQKVTGPNIWTAFNNLLRKKIITSTFPEAKSGVDSGRQFFKLA